MSSCEENILESHLDPHGLATGITPKGIVLRIRGDRRQGRFRFVKNPATGALEPPAHLRAEISGALMTEVRRIHYRLYLLQTLLYLEALRFKGLSALQRVVGNFKCHLLELG